MNLPKNNRHWYSMNNFFKMINHTHEILIKFETIILLINDCPFWQIEWLNNYNQKVRDEIGPLLKGNNKEAFDWLQRRTEKISVHDDTSFASCVRTSKTLIIVLVSPFVTFYIGYLNV